MIDLNEQRKPARMPTLANSEFLTNKEQGDWAEDVICRAINENATQYFALKYGRSDSISAGDPGFEEFFARYQEELNLIGKKPDLLIFKRSDIGSNPNDIDFDDDAIISKAIVAIEIRSSSFLANKYNAFMTTKLMDSNLQCAPLLSSSVF